MIHLNGVMNLPENNLNENVKGDEFSFGDTFIICTSILTSIFTAIYISLRSTLLRSSSLNENSLNDIILDTATSSPLWAICSALIGGLIGAVMLFRWLKKKVISQENEIKTLNQRVRNLEESKTIHKPSIEPSPIKPNTEAKPNVYYEIKPKKQS